LAVQNGCHNIKRVLTDHYEKGHHPPTKKNNHRMNFDSQDKEIWIYDKHMKTSQSHWEPNLISQARKPYKDNITY